MSQSESGIGARVGATKAFTPDPSWPSIVELAKERWGEPTQSKRDDIRFGAKGSKSVKPSANIWHDHETDERGGYVEMHRATRGELPQDIATIYDYRDADGTLILQVIRTLSGKPPFLQRKPNGSNGWDWRTRDIPPANRPLYRLPGLRASGDATVWICEGEKDADNLHNEGLIATTSIGGAGKWQAAYAAEFRGKPCVVLQDNDEAGRKHTHMVVRSIAGVASSVRVLLLPNLPPKGDVSDWLEAGGTVAELERLAREAPEYSRPEPVPSPTQDHPEVGRRGTPYGRLLVLGMADLDTAEPRDYLLKGLLSPSEISIWVGPPKCGKSFLLLYVAYMLSLGRRVFGRRVKLTKVLYVAAEGEAGIANRIRALRMKYGPSENFHFIAQPADLLHEAGDKATLIQAAQAVGATLIVLDTLSRLLAGGDENSPQDMGAFVRNVTEIRHDTGAHISIVHHGTKASNGSNPRGHSCLTGADDALIEVTKLDDGSRQATVIHAKDDPDGMRWGFNLDVVDLGADNDGDPITTLLTTEAEAPAKDNHQERLSDGERIALRTLDQAFKADAILATVFDNDAEGLAVRESDWRRWFYREGMPGAEQEAKKKAFQRAMKGLIAKARIGTRDDFVWPK